MGRLVRKPQAPDVDLQLAGLDGILAPSGIVSPAANGEPGDDYIGRMVKYIPAEVIGFLMVVNAILEQALRSGGKAANMAGIPVTSIATGALLAAIVLTPLFCWYVRQEGDAWVVNAIVSTIALPFWAYLMGAVAFADHHDGNLAAILVLSFTVMSGLISPRARKRKRRDKKKEAASKEGPRLVEALPA
jgi:hypothetical protein